MIWLRHPLGGRFVLDLTAPGTLEGVEAACAARGPSGSLWPLEVQITDAPGGRYRLDAGNGAPLWPSGILWLDWRLSRGAVTVYAATLGILVQSPEEAAEAHRRDTAAAPGADQRRVWAEGGDVLDALCRRELGSERPVAEVLALNPGLAALGLTLPAGLGVILPARAAPSVVVPQIRLWGDA